MTTKELVNILQRGDPNATAQIVVRGRPYDIHAVIAKDLAYSCGVRKTVLICDERQSVLPAAVIDRERRLSDIVSRVQDGSADKHFADNPPFQTQ